jgi:FKBP-type peptidyl-prolyl cis-trans isomerase (trigger factor)
VANLSFDLPKTLHQEVISQRLKQEETNKENNPEASVDEDALKAEIEKDLRRHLINENIADTLKVEATREDLQQQIAMAAYQSGQKSEDVAKQLQESGRIHQVAAEIRSAKALAMFVESVVKAHSPEEEVDKAEG